MKSKTRAGALALALFASGCTLFFGAAHHDEARCVQRCRAMRWTVAAVAYHGDFASTCVCQPPGRAATSEATTNAITPAQTAGSSGAAIAAARPWWRNVPVVLP
jgi:hypothetical protein